jgi:ABC-type nitrate/sulfonate/bicarbonate transport system substrate-binding protein
MVFKAYDVDPVETTGRSARGVDLDRRSLMGKAAAAALGLSLPRTSGARAEGAKDVVRISLSSPGSAGAIWKPLVAQTSPEDVEGMDLQWIGADPGQMQVQLMAGTLDVGSFGAVGLSTSVLKGGDIVLFGPSLNNHGRWIVRGDSSYQTPKDLVGKRIATQPKTTETFNQAQIAASLTGLDLVRQFEIIFGPPAANVALFERGDVEAVIALEPTATRLIGRGAREIARVGEMWQAGTGTHEPPFLVGLAATRRWVDTHRDSATRIARLFAKINGQLQKHPDLFVTYSRDFGFKPGEDAAVRLLPERLPDVYATKWDRSVWSSIDAQVDVALRVGALTARPQRPLYDGRALDS